MRRQGGFTLLEMMIATAVLALALTWLVEATSRAIAAENRAKLTATATFLARERMVEVEDEIAEKGFTDDAFAKTSPCEFTSKEFKRFKCEQTIDKVELPAQDQVQSMMSKALEAKTGAAGMDKDKLPGGLNLPMGMGMDPSKLGAGAAGSGAGAGGLLGGASGGFLQSQFGIIKNVLEQGIRRVKVTVSWEEGSKTRSIEIYEYLTDPRRVDMAFQAGMAGMTGMPGVPGATGGAGSTGTTGTTGPATSGPAGSSILR